MANADLKKFLPTRLSSVIGKNMPALIASFNQGAEAVEQTIQACIDQLFISTASGKYLLTLGEEGGFTIPPNSGLDIRAFRVLVPIMISNPKQVRISIQDLVQAFYGSERTKANILSETVGPFSLNENDDLIIETDAGSVIITVLANQVSDINAVSAGELASIINYSQSLISAETYLNRSNGLESLRLLSKTPGTGSYIRVVGGKLQNVLKLPKLSNTNLTSGITLNITKTSALSDILKIQWDGLGVNPDLYNVKKDDIVTIRNLVDSGPDLFSKINGSYTILDSGYDYFVIRNITFSSLSSSLSLVDQDQIVFTSQEKNTLFDKAEYAFLSEIEDQTITITVPAVPPLAVRFLQGSAHLHGSLIYISDFTRNSLTLDLPTDEDIPDGDNQFVISGRYYRPNFAKTKYKTVFTNSDPLNLVYQLETGDTDFEVFPYTIPTVVSNNPIRGTVESSDYKITFPYPHGLQGSWGFTLSGAVGSSNILSAELNQEHVVKEVLSPFEIVFSLKDTNGTPKKFEGFAILTPDVIRHSVNQSDGSDFYLSYPDSSTLLAAGFAVGDIFTFDPAAGIDINPSLANTLKYNKFTVSSILNTGSLHRVNFTLGIGPGSTGVVIQSAEGFRSGNFGSSVSYFTDKSTTYNQKIIFSEMKAIFMGYTKSSNPDYVGSFLYDPRGANTSVTVSKYVANLTDNILKGSAQAAVFVDNLNINGEFPKSGKIILGYGTDTFEGPISYYSTISSNGNNQILIDPAYKFKFSHAVGVSVQYIHATSPYVPDRLGSSYPVYLTGTTQAREAMFILINSLIAAGVFTEKEILFPDLKYSDIAMPPFD